MEWLYRHTQIKLGIFSVIGAFLVTFSNLICIPWEMTFYDESEHLNVYGAYLFRLLFFIGVIWALLEFNLQELKYYSFKRRFWGNFLIVAGSYLLFALLCKFFGVSKIDCTRYSVYIQFMVVFVFSLIFGHVMVLYMEKHRRELEIERLQTESQRSRCEALANQINPHFFFNSLNSLSALIRKKDEEKTLAFLNKLSDVFRYTLQSDKKELVTLREEIDFVHAFGYMMEVRFANKLSFDIDIKPEALEWRLPVLSLLPLIDNVVIHNAIDSDHKMVVKIWINDQDELVVANPIFPKFTPPVTNGTGLANLKNRFILLMGKNVRVEKDETNFCVYLSLQK